MSKRRRDIKIKVIDGRSYAYDMISYWDKEMKKYRKKSIYLGVITDKKTKEYRPKGSSAQVAVEVKNEIIRNFGDSYSIAEVINSCCFQRFQQSLKRLSVDYDTLMSLVIYKIIKSTAMQYAEVWSRGNYVSYLYPAAELKSQRISEFLKTLGREEIWRNFFADYIATVTKSEKTGIIVDSTGMPNEIDIPLSAWGSHGGDCQLETRLLIVIDKTSGRPLYFRYMAGNIVDVSTLKNTVTELYELGVKTSFVLLDAGYVSEDNIKELYENKISFLTRLPAGRKLHKELIDDSVGMEKAENLVIYNKRALFIKKVVVDLYDNKCFAYVVCDVRRKGDETNKYMITAKDDGAEQADIDKELNRLGKFVMLSPEDLSSEEVLPLYYTHQVAENIFGLPKSFLDLLPLRTHSIETFRGYLMLTFIALVVCLEIKNRLGTKYTVEAAMMEMGNLMCKIYDKKVIICEPTKNMKEIAALLGYIVPKELGI